MRKAGKLQKTEEGTARYGVTKFSDLTEEEFKQYVGKKWREVKNFNPELKKADIPKGPIPESFDWREHGAVTAVKNQVCNMVEKNQNYLYFEAAEYVDMLKKHCLIPVSLKILNKKVLLSLELGRCRHFGKQ